MTIAIKRKLLHAPIWGLITLLTLAFSCHKPKYSETPNISFKSLEKIESQTGIDNMATFTIHFEDGDGDVGLDDNDTNSPFDTASAYYYNWFIDFYEKQHGEFVKIDVGKDYNVRLPRLSRSYPESIEGDVSVDIFINNYTSQYDTIRLQTYIVDRALHVSNTITTPEIIVKKKK